MSGINLLPLMEAYTSEEQIVRMCAFLYNSEKRRVPGPKPQGAGGRVDLYVPQSSIIESSLKELQPLIEEGWAVHICWPSRSCTQVAHHDDGWWKWVEGSWVRAEDFMARALEVVEQHRSQDHWEYSQWRRRR